MSLKLSIFTYSESKLSHVFPLLTVCSLAAAVVYVVARVAAATALGGATLTITQIWMHSMFLCWLQFEKWDAAFEMIPRQVQLISFVYRITSPLPSLCRQTGFVQVLTNTAQLTICYSTYRTSMSAPNHTPNILFVGLQPVLQSFSCREGCSRCISSLSTSAIAWLQFVEFSVVSII